MQNGLRSQENCSGMILVQAFWRLFCKWGVSLSRCQTWCGVHVCSWKHWSCSWTTPDCCSCRTKICLQLSKKKSRRSLCHWIRELSVHVSEVVLTSWNQITKDLLLLSLFSRRSLLKPLLGAIMLERFWEMLEWWWELHKKRDASLTRTLHHLQPENKIWLSLFRTHAFVSEIKDKADQFNVFSSRWLWEMCSSFCTFWQPVLRVWLFWIIDIGKTRQAPLLNPKESSSVLTNTIPHANETLMEHIEFPEESLAWDDGTLIATCVWCIEQQFAASSNGPHRRDLQSAASHN